MIAVVGEALIDLIVDPHDPRHPTAHPGGSPANVALTLARLGSPVTFLGRSGRDAFGGLIRDHLAANGVDLRYLVAAAEPSSIALVTVHPDRGATYTFHVAGTADWAWTTEELPRACPDDIVAIHTGSLALALRPGGQILESWLARRRERHTISLDPNVRPALVGPRQEYRARLEAWVVSSDLVKVSAEDLAWVYPGTDPIEVAQRWLEIPGGPTLVVVTLGPAGAAACLGGQVIRRPAAATTTVDTVGAGDAFSGGLLDWLHRTNRLRRDALRSLTADEAVAAVDFASTVAAVTCGRAGADPPHRHELDLLAATARA